MSSTVTKTGQATFLWDSSAGKHKGHRNSVAANLKAHPYKAPMRERVRIWVDSCGFHGTTLKEICEHFDKLPHQVSGRISELKAAKKIFDSGRDQDGYSVLVSRRAWVSGSAGE